METDFIQSPIFTLVVIPILIFLARILDVSVGTLRIIFVSKGLKYLAAILGFIESLVWVLAISQVIQNLNSWITYIAFALGFAAGNLVGMMLEERIAMGNLIVRIITRREADELVSFLRSSGYGVTDVDAQGEAGPVTLLFTIVKRRKLPEVIAIIKRFNPNAFYTVEDVRFVKETYYPPVRTGGPAAALAMGKKK
jgi:uncharacterized protein YebE (UPF0316 family)